MSNSPDQSQPYNDEIDLADLVRALWQGKWLVIGVTLATLALGIAYLLLAPKNYTASLEINALNSVEAEVYAELNDSAFLLVNDQSLLSQFVEEVQSKQTIESFIKSNGYIEQQAEETDREFAFRIRQSVYDFDLVPPVAATNNKPKTEWTLNISTHNPKLAFQITKDALELSNQKVSNQLLSNFERLEDKKSRGTKFALEDLDFQKRRVMVKYQFETESRLALLTEQAATARALGIAKQSLLTANYSNSVPSVTGSSSMSTVGIETPMYLRGYTALEKEILLLNTRPKPENFIPELTQINIARLQLLQDATISRAQERLALTPIGSDAFTAVAYDMASIVFKSNRKTSLILALSIVLGGMLGIFVLLIRNTIINKD
jgi:chain length determinant protein (polysaccharide antigen chain regulator)